MSRADYWGALYLCISIEKMIKRVPIFSTSPLAQKAYLVIVFIMNAPLASYCQDSTTNHSHEIRTFMPLIQMGYVTHGTSELSGGLMTQTSAEYRAASNLIFRINYDGFNSTMNLKYPINPEISYTGVTSFSELIGGIGYRKKINKHHIIAYIQSGIKFYGYPVFTESSNDITLSFDNRNIGVMRYSMGYEFEIIPTLFLSLETLTSHVLQSKDFWTADKWAYGITIGITAPLF